MGFFHLSIIFLFFFVWGSVYFDSKGAGNLNIKSEYSSFVSETYGLIDAKYYADNTKINSFLTSFDGHLTAFINYALKRGDKIIFKFNTKPIHCLFGIGASSSSCFVLECNTNQTKIHRSYGSALNYSNNWLDNHSNIGMEISTVSSQDRMNLYFEDIYFDYWVCQLQGNNTGLRIDKFSNDEYNIEVIVL